MSNYRKRLVITITGETEEGLGFSLDEVKRLVLDGFLSGEGWYVDEISSEERNACDHYNERYVTSCRIEAMDYRKRLKEAIQVHRKLVENAASEPEILDFELERRATELHDFFYTKAPWH